MTIKKQLHRFLPAVAVIVAIAAVPRAEAETFQVLHNFGSGTDGGVPSGNLIQDSTGTFYGTSFWGHL